MNDDQCKGLCIITGMRGEKVRSSHAKQQRLALPKLAQTKTTNKAFHIFAPKVTLARSALLQATSHSQARALHLDRFRRLAAEASHFTITETDAFLPRHFAFILYWSASLRTLRCCVHWRRATLTESCWGANAPALPSAPTIR